MADPQLPRSESTTFEEFKMNTNIYIPQVLPYQGSLVQTIEVIELFQKNYLVHRDRVPCFNL